MVRQGVTEDFRGECHVGLGLADAGMRAHGGADEKAVRRVRREKT